MKSHIAKMKAATFLLLITLGLLSLALAIAPRAKEREPQGAPPVTYIDASDRLGHSTWNSILDTVTAAGVCLFDANGDGLEDIFIPGLGALNTDPNFVPGNRLGNSLYINKGNDASGLPAFEEIGERAGVLGLGKLGVGCAAADYDNDGDEDILVTNATRGALYSMFGALDPQGSGVKTTPPPFFHTDGTDGKYNFPAEGGVTLYRNEGAEGGSVRFSDATLEANLTKGGNGTAAAWADVDRDGNVDLFVGNYGDFDFAGFTEKRFPGHFDWIYRNSGDGTFMDMSETAGVKGKPEFVYDLKGNKQMAWDPELRDKKGNVAGDPAGNLLAAAFLDYDRDGLPDLLTADDIPGRIRLYHNLGDFRFEEVSEANDFGAAGAWMGLAVGDVDGDGKEDVFATNMGGPRGSRYRLLSGKETYMNDILTPPNKGSFYNSLWKWNGSAFRNFAKETTVDWGDWKPDIRWYPPEQLRRFAVSSPPPKGLEEGEFGFGAVLYDYENDGDLDLFWIGSLARSLLFDQLKMGSIYVGNPGRLLENSGTGSAFRDVSKETGISNLSVKGDRASYENGRGVAVGDFNNDGYNDMVMTNAGGWDSPDPRVPSFEHLGLTYRTVGVSKEYRPGPTRLFIAQGGGSARSPRGTNNWLKLKLTGTKSNRSAIGAVVEVGYTENGVKKRAVRTVRAGESYASQNSLELLFGLGTSKRIDEVTISWPSGVTQTLKRVKANQRLIIVEPQ